MAAFSAIAGMEVAEKLEFLPSFKVIPSRLQVAGSESTLRSGSASASTVLDLPITYNIDTPVQ